MCGIYGTTIVYNQDQVKQKLKRTGFRGPDQLGFKNVSSDRSFVCFGHNRLSIIDLDPRSNQPFTYKNKVHLVFNGEIYNFKDLKESLLKKGYTFNTHSDTEVVCAMYLEYGEDCVTHFNGMFAFVIYDVEQQLFFGARDRLGQKPFYYYHNGNKFEFSSQIASIQLFNTNLTISQKAINGYYAWGAVPDTQSIFNEIKKLEAGYLFTFDLISGTFNKKAYWDIDYKHHDKFQGSFTEAKAHLDTLLSDAVKKRLFADVPVGVFLSGGIDSSIISALAVKSSDTKIKTFSVKFNEKGFDESAYAEKVAEHLQTEHHTIECDYKEGIDLIENFSTFYDEPFSDSSAIPSMLLSKYTKQHVTVALSGDAGDENFIGYHRYQWINQAVKLLHIPRPLRRLMAPLLQVAPNNKLNRLSRVITSKDLNDFYLKLMTGTNPTWYTQKDNTNVKELQYLKHTHKNILERISDFDLKTYLNWDINTKVDRASMAFSLEVRAPLLDYRVVEFARSLPTNYKFNNGNTKYVLKELLYDYVPKDYFDRPKSGFTMPFAEWFRNDLKSFVLDELDDTSLKLLPDINVKEVKKRIDQHMSGTHNRYALIWNLIVLKQWLTKNGKGYSIN